MTPWGYVGCPSGDVWDPILGFSWVPPLGHWVWVCGLHVTQTHGCHMQWLGEGAREYVGGWA